MGLRLFLDDVRPTPEGWTRAYSVNEAISIVEDWLSPDPDFEGHLGGYGRPVFEACSLDHDLGDYEPAGGDGYKFVLWMAETGIWPQTKPQVHSMNPVGGRRMREDIDRYFPGG